MRPWLSKSRVDSGQFAGSRGLFAWCSYFELEVLDWPVADIGLVETGSGSVRQACRLRPSLAISGIGSYEG